MAWLKRLWTLWRLRRQIRKFDREVETSVWGDPYDNWYPDYPFTERRVEKRGKGVVEPAPDKHARDEEE